jgi:hypothetical protein
MKYLHLNTASSFASDYRLFSYQARQSDWEPTEATPVELWEKHCPSGLAAFEQNLNLGYRGRSFSMWICGNDLGPGHFCAITITGMASGTRKDFMGRIIYDSLSLINAYDQARYEQDPPSFACDQANIALNALDAFAGNKWSLDSAANQNDFDMDTFAFSDIDRVYSLLSARRECDIRTGPTEESGVAHQLVLQLLRRLDIDFSIEENASGKGSEPKHAYLRRDSLRDLIDERIDSMAEVAEEIKDGIEDKVASVLGEKHSQMLLKPLRVMEGFFKRGPSVQVEDSGPASRGGAEENYLGNRCLYITCKNRPNLDIAKQLQCGLLDIWASNPSVAIGLSIARPTSEPTSNTIDVHRQGGIIVITTP